MRCGSAERSGGFDIYIYAYIFRYLVESKYPSAGHFAYHLGNRALTAACLDEGRGWFGSGVWLSLSNPAASVVIRPYSQGLYTKENTKMAKEEIFSKKYSRRNTFRRESQREQILVDANLGHEHREKPRGRVRIFQGYRALQTFIFLVSRQALVVVSAGTVSL